MRNLQEQVKKAFCYQKFFWPFTVWINCSKAHSLSKKFCTMIPFSKNDIWCQLWLGWKGLVRVIPFSKNKDRAELFTQWMDFNKILLQTLYQSGQGCRVSIEFMSITSWLQKIRQIDTSKRNLENCLETSHPSIFMNVMD